MSFCVESADSSEKRISASAVAEPSAPIDNARSHSPRWIASTPSWIAVAPEAQAVESVMGRPRAPNQFGEAVGDRSELGRIEKICRVQSSSGRKQALISLVFVRGLVERESITPIEFHRRGSDEKRTAEIARIHTRLGERFARDGFGEFIGQRARTLAA